MRLSEREIGRIPPGNLRVPRGEFVALWVAAEELGSAQAGRGVTDWPLGGVVVTCRWVARAVTENGRGRRSPTRAPVTRRSVLAIEEELEAEYLASEKLLARPFPSVLMTGQPGYVEAVSATLRWAWRGVGSAPVLVPVAAG
ncbi:hypothetical protein ACFFOU_30560 [Pseudonocardia sulfidoxydans]|uniref:hypothetical protein n=1 Tax=Pseudonocardia sulfidoxydans TaxID=54011 RepID=UPI0011BF685F|nr:hypothetical protein [Pseudonocardia sulfidoxydans]